MLITENVVLTYKNARGLVARIGVCEDLFPTTIEDTIENEFSTFKQVNSHGSILNKFSVGERPINIVGIIKSNDIVKAERDLNKVFNLSVGGTLEYYNKYSKVKRTVECRVVSKPKVSFQAESYSWQFEVELICHNPFWVGRAVKENISKTLKCGFFPLAIKQESYIFGSQVENLRTKFFNDGDIEAGNIITLVANGGTVLNPVIEHAETGAKIKIVYKMEKGDVIQITMTPKLFTLTLNEKYNAMGYLTDETARTPFLMQIGENVIKYYAEENTTNLKIMASYSPLYQEV